MSKCFSGLLQNSKTRKHKQFPTALRMQIQPMVTLRSHAEEREARSPVHLLLVCQQRWGRKWNGSTNFACQTTFTTSGISVNSCIPKVHGVCNMSFSSSIHNIINALVDEQCEEGLFHMNMTMKSALISPFDKMPSEEPLDLRLLGLLTSSLKGTSLPQTLSPTTTCTAGTFMTHRSFRP